MIRFHQMVGVMLFLIEKKMNLHKRLDQVQI